MGVLWMARAKQQRVLCSRCERKLDDGPYCPSCGYPVPWATHEDRIEWELREWENRIVAPPPSARPPIWGRRGEPKPKPKGNSRSPARAKGKREPASDPMLDGRVASNGRRRASATARASVPVRPPAITGDVPVVLTVLRLLNSRIAELEARIAELEGKPAPRAR